MTNVQKLDKAFRQYLLNKATKDKWGNYFCPLLEKWVVESQIQVCHYIPRMYRGTRWDETNCILCSKQTNEGENEFVEGVGNIHLNRFRKYLGLGTVMYLDEIKENKLTNREMENLYKKFKDGN